MVVFWGVCPFFDRRAWEPEPEAWQVADVAWEPEPQAWQVADVAWEPEPEAWQAIADVAWELEGRGMGAGGVNIHGTRQYGRINTCAAA